jgi:FkbH-like protein
VPQEVVDWPEYLSNYDCFAKFYISSEDVKKNIQYKNRAKFILESSNAIDEIDYLKSIQLQPSIHNFEKSNIERAAQLCSKTNQFNFRTVRHNAADLIILNEEFKDFCFLVGLKDIYGDHGIVGLVCLKKINSQYAFIDTFVLSCRVLGRHLESWILSETLKRCYKDGIKYLIGEFISTQSNTVADDFFINHGFTFIDKNSDLEKMITESSFTNNGKLFKIITNPNNIPYMEPYEIEKN